ncbi:hypothetical protein HELRODRAFT_177817 [Helobdella robusta]|uniref:Methyltransferase domain-containing protein n=1 Tax=Helobdella robusta TaxID=6412 RepID=T1FCB5_HELRO|nr:hypothetical protein HELRODRAFT_177817 [Helobdella robusta]ESN97755.1 hypothetical protein HELRODRAFT_177817 [Helobdella robusta]
MDDANDSKYSCTESLHEIRQLGVYDVYKGTYDQVGVCDGVERVIAIGCGTAVCELEFLKRVAPNMKHLILVDKDAVCLEQLKMNLSNSLHKDIVGELHSSEAQQWQGPNIRVDLITMFHCLYYFKPEERKEFYRKCFNDWLNPGGKLYIKLAKDLHENNDEDTLNSFYRKTGRRPQLEAFTIKEEVRSLGYKIESEHHYEFYLDLKLFNNRMLHFVQYDATPPYENLDVIKKEMNKMIADGKKAYGAGILFCVVNNVSDKA